MGDENSIENGGLSRILNIGSAGSSDGTGTDTSAAGSPAGTAGGLPAKRKRGRPPKDAGTNGLPIREIEIEGGEIPGPQIASEKPAPKKRAKKNLELETLTQNVEMVTNTAFQIASLFAGPHWAIAPEEARLVAEPTARILDRLELTETSNKYTDYLMLVIALAGITIPRIMMSQQIRPKKEKGGLEVVRSAPEINRTIERPAEKFTPADGLTIKELYADVSDEFGG